MIDYGVGNSLSVAAAIEFLGHTVVIDQDGSCIGSCPINVIPGVAHFGTGIVNLMERGQASKLASAFDAGDLIVGLCLGAQMLLDSSEEAPGVHGLSMIPGNVLQLEKGLYPVPNHGWRQLSAATGSGSLLTTLTSRPYVFFSHSYQCIPRNDAHIVRTASVGSAHVNAILAHQNAVGVQFHPEKSGEDGLRILSDILKFSSAFCSIDS